jgi:putative salt-induced outer membrane protein YdiY
MRFFLLLFTLFTLSFGVVSIAPVEIGTKPGTSGQINASFQTQRGNTETDAYSGGLKLQYDDNASYLTWGEATVNYAEASGVKNTNATYLHLRYIHTFNDIKNVNWETFAQSETNQFTRIQERFVTGGGMRFHIKDDELGTLYLGTGAFYEYIDYSTNVDMSENNLRGNFYLAYKKAFSKDSAISYAGYYQPKLNHLNDYLLSNGLELQVYVYEKIYLSLKLSYLVDTKPAIGIKAEDFSQITSFVYKF